MRLIHLTDPHLTSLARWGFGDLRGKRWSGYLSWRRRRRHQLRRDMLDRLVAAVQAEAPTQIAVTGDLAHIGLPGEIAAAADWLAELGPPERVFLVPGNHDVYARDSWPAVASTWREYLGVPPDAAAGGDRDAYPIVRRREGVWLVGASSSMPTAPFLATGELGAAQLARLGVVLEAAREQGALVCLLIHHPPLPGIAGRRKRLVDADRLAELLVGAAVPVALHGHLHEDLVRRHGELRVFGTAAASSVVADEPASYRVLDLERSGAQWRLRMTLKRHDPSSGRFEAVAREEWLAPARPR